jgi:predicted short-subunit dehydrogenase-like oxidoreductase (DUF2520 family)
MNISIYGTGRAAGALGIAFSAAGHTIVDVSGRNAERVEAMSYLFDTEPGDADLRVIAVSDDAIPEVANLLAPLADGVATVHVSGAVSVAALAPIAASGSRTGSFHPLQTMPDAVNGARQIPGAWIGITAAAPLDGQLASLAESIGCHPFTLGDGNKPLYHAAAAASANFVLAALAVAEGLFDASGVPFEAARPLVDAIVENAFTLGPSAALTGPIARGDTGTVASQVAAVRSGSPELLSRFTSLSAITAETAGTSERFRDLLA